MAAGLGFKTFTTGEVLTAGDVNGYLMQGVLVFASEAARNAAITSPQEGQFAYTKDNNSLWYYTGSAWAASGATGDIEGVTVTSPLTGGGTSGTVTVGILSGTTSNLGAVQLSDSTSSTSTTLAATANAVKTSYDLAGAAIPKSTVTTAGDVIYATGSSAVTRLGVGSTGQVLTVAGGVPSWATPASSGGMTLLATTTLTGASVTISSLSTYKQLLFVFRGAKVASNSSVELRFNGDTGDKYSCQEFKVVNTTISSGGGWSPAGSSLMTRMGDSATTTNLYQGNLIVNATDQTSGVSYFCTGGFQDGTGNVSTLITGRYANSAVISSATFIAVGTTFSSGTVLTYGVN
jgi:hypothetical protein